MILGALAAVLGLLAAPVASAEEVASGKVAELRALDRISGALTDLFVPVGEGVELGPLAVSVVECRYPVANPAGDAYAYLLIDDMCRGPSCSRAGWLPRRPVSTRSTTCAMTSGCCAAVIPEDRRAGPGG